MREIKLRAFDLDNWNMYYSDKDEETGEGPVIWVLDKDGIHFQERAFDSWSDPDDEKMHWYQPTQDVMQYIWKKDSEGKEIYAGDIVEVIQEIGPDATELIWKAAIEFNSAYGVYLKHITKFPDDHEFNYSGFLANMYGMDEEENCQSFKILGNIYENPELLKK